MIPMRNLPVQPALVLLLVLLLHCTENTPDNLAGGLETTNGVTIRIIDDTITGVTAAYSRIIICDTAYVPREIKPPRFIDTVISDTKGNFTIQELPRGVYTLVVLNTDIASGCIIRPINVDYDDITALNNTIAFVPLSNIPVQTRIDSAIAPQTIVFIPGTPFQALTGQAGTGLLTGIPNGTYRVNAYLNKPRDLIPFKYTATVNDVNVTDSTATLNMQLTPQ